LRSIYSVAPPKAASMSEGLDMVAAATASSGLKACREAKLVSKQKLNDAGGVSVIAPLDEDIHRSMDLMPDRGAICDSTASGEHKRGRCVSFKPKLDSTVGDDEMEEHHATTDRTSICGDAMTVASSSNVVAQSSCEHGIYGDAMMAASSINTNGRCNTWDGEVLHHNISGISEYWDGQDDDEARSRCGTTPFLDMSKSDTVKASAVRTSLWEDDELSKENSMVDIDAAFPPPKTSSTSPRSGTTTGEFVGMIDIAFDQDTGEVVEVFEGQGKLFGVQVGWIIQRIDGVPFSCAQFKRKRDRGVPYRLTFLKRNASDGLGPPGTELTYIPGLFGPTKSRDCTYENVKMGRVCDIANVADMCTPTEDEDRHEPPKHKHGL